MAKVSNLSFEQEIKLAFHNPYQGTTNQIMYRDDVTKKLTIITWVCTPYSPFSYTSIELQSKKRLETSRTTLCHEEPICEIRWTSCPIHFFCQTHKSKRQEIYDYNYIINHHNLLLLPNQNVLSINLERLTSPPKFRIIKNIDI